MTFLAVICILASWVCFFLSGRWSARRKRNNADALEDLYQAARLIKDDPERAEVEIIKRVEELDGLKETPAKLPWYKDFEYFARYVLFAEHGAKRNPNPTLMRIRSWTWDAMVAFPLFVMLVPMTIFLGPVLILKDLMQEKR